MRILTIYTCSFNINTKSYLYIYAFIRCCATSSKCLMEHSTSCEMLITATVLLRGCSCSVNCSHCSINHWTSDGIYDRRTAFARTTCVVNNLAWRTEVLRLACAKKTVVRPIVNRVPVFVVSVLLTGISLICFRRV